MAKRKKILSAGETINSLKGIPKPASGMWYISWALVDRDANCPTPWPNPDTAEYIELAVWIAKISETSLDEIFQDERYSYKNANHCISVDGIGQEWKQRWTEICKKNKLDEDHETGVALAAFTYCLAGKDSRRIFMGFRPEERVIYPIWWYPNHDIVYMQDGYNEAPIDADHSSCHHIDAKFKKKIQQP